VALYEQGRVHHVGLFGDLEEQVCSWVPGQGQSSDRLDAPVWPVWSLTLEPVGIAWVM
jgi:phage terminase large subunit-like protein